MIWMSVPAATDSGNPKSWTVGRKTVIALGGQNGDTVTDGKW